MQAAAVILAAGASTRYGSPKQLARVGTGSMLDAVVGIARLSALSPIVVVLPSKLRPPAGVTAVVNDAPREGMSRSLRLGLAAVPDEASAALILLGDQPTVPAGVIADILRARGARPIVAARAAGLLGPPVLLERRVFVMAEALKGQHGLRDLIRGNRHLVTPVEVGEHAPDVDTPADLTRIGHMFDSPKPVCLSVRWMAREGREEALAAAIEELAARTRREPGSVMFATHRSTAEPRRFLFYERYRDAAAFDEHLATPHLKAVLDRLDELVVEQTFEQWELLSP